MTFLSKTIYYGNYENIEYMPKVAEELISKSHLDNMSKSRSQSKDRLGVSKFNNDETLYKSKPQNQQR
jgi:hypothetical protein